MKKKIKLCNIIIFGIHPMILDLAADVFQLFLTQNSFENVKVVSPHLKRFLGHRPPNP